MSYIQFKNGIPFIRTWELQPGDKITDADCSEEGCRKISDELTQNGISNRVAQNPESGIWSVVILE